MDISDWDKRSVKAVLKGTSQTNDGPVRGKYDFGYGRYEVEIEGVTLPEIRYIHNWHDQRTNPRTYLPNMDVSEGYLRIPIEDLAEEILARMEPDELALELLRVPEARTALIDTMIRRYADPGIDDEDRRRLLAGLKEEVHSRALDVLSSAMQAAEYAARETAHRQEHQRQFHYWIDGATETLRKYPEAYADLVDHHGWGKVFASDPEERDFSIGGKHWNEAQQFWRDEVLRQFPMPPVASEPDSPEEI